MAVSGGPDSLSLAYLSKCYAIQNHCKMSIFIVDHKLRKESSKESKHVQKIWFNTWEGLWDPILLEFLESNLK